MTAFIAAAFGLLIGSFLNVCICRWPRDESVVKPRSHCRGCNRTIAWYDNIPILSFLLLKAKCRHCGTGISLRYPAVELLTALSFGLFAYRYGPTAEAAKYCLLSAILIGCIFSDLETLLLPDQFTVGGLIVGIAVSFFIAMPAGIFISSPMESIAGAIVPAGILWLTGWLFEKIRHKEGLGFGDVKMLAMIGAFLGLRGALLTVILASVIGAIAGLIYIKAASKDAGSYQLPFGTFLGAAALFAAAGLSDWYWRILLGQ